TLLRRRCARICHQRVNAVYLSIHSHRRIEMNLSSIPYSKPGEMTDMDRFVFECCGYIVIEDVLSDAECDEVLAAATHLHEGHPKERLLQLGKGFETEPAIERLI